MASIDLLPPSLGDTVDVLNRRTGTVRWVGPSTSGVGLVGVQLAAPVSFGTDGTAPDGTRCFDAAPGTAVFVDAAAVSEFDATRHAACVIQAVGRGHLARCEVRFKHNWEVYNALDNDAEHLHIERSKLLAPARVLAAAKAESVGAVAFDAPPSHEVGEAAMRFSVIPVEDDYRGPHLEWPLTVDQVQALMAAFQEGHRLHFKYVMQIFAEFRSVMMAADETVVRFEVPAGGRLTVVGDLHGQLKDALHILDTNGVPTAHNCYLWNGDFVDRGPNGIEVVMILFAWKILYPKAVLLNRGNHEDRSQNEYYSCQTHGCWGFHEEINHKYGYNGLYERKVYAAAHHCFELLPLATVVNESVLVIHGGLFRESSITLRDIEAINRKRQIPLPEGPTTVEDSVFEDLMWSDPTDADGFQTSSRNAGVLFGPDVTASFMEANNLEYMIRSHECVDEGIRWQKGDKLVTVFSASHYNGYPNHGGIIMLSDKLHMTAYQYQVSSAKNALLTAKQRRLRHEQHIRELIQERICECKPTLYWHFTRHDAANTGKIPLLVWSHVMKTVLNLPRLPWLYLRPSLCELSEDGSVVYSEFLDRYRVTLRGDGAWQEEVVNQVCRKLYEAHSTLEKAYQSFDTNKDGKLEYSEFLAALESLDLGLTHNVIYELMRSIDVDVDTTIDWEEFKKRFHISFQAASKPVAAGAGPVEPLPIAGAGTPSKVDTGTGAACVVLDDWTQKALEKIGACLLSSATQAREVFDAIDTDKSQSVSLEEFGECLERLGLSEFSDEEVRRIFSAIDADDSGQLDITEFLSAFSVRLYEPDEKDGGWEAAIIERIVAVLYSFRVELRTAFSMFDLDSSSLINASEFRAGLQALAHHLESPLSEYQINALLKYLDTDGDGLLNYEEFLGGFALCSS